MGGAEWWPSTESWSFLRVMRNPLAWSRLRDLPPVVSLLLPRQAGCPKLLDHAAFFSPTATRRLWLRPSSNCSQAHHCERDLRAKAIDIWNGFSLKSLRRNIWMFFSPLCTGRSVLPAKTIRLVARLRHEQEDRALHNCQGSCDSWRSPGPRRCDRRVA